MSKKSKFIRIASIFVLIIAVIYIITPVVAVRAINWALSHKIENYSGKIKDLDYLNKDSTFSVSNFILHDKKNPDHLKIDIQSVSVKVNWKDFFDKKLVSEVYIDGADVQITELPKPDKTKENPWVLFRKKMIETSWDVSISKFELDHGRIEFKVPKTKNTLTVSNLHVITNQLVFAPEESWRLSPFWVTALLQGQGHIKSHGSVFVMAEKPAIDIDFSLEKLDMKKLNGILLSFLPADITSGSLSLFAENATQKGESMGYAKIFLDDIDVVANPQRFKTGRHVFVEAAAAVGNWALKNRKNDSVALVIPYKLKHDKVKFDKSEAFWSSIENKIDKLDRKLDQTISFETLSEDTSLD